MGKKKSSARRGRFAAGRSRSQLGVSTRSARRLANAQGAEGVPPHHVATLVYPFAFTSSSTTGNLWDWQFRLNSLFDPDFTGGGAQPTTFDQWMALYDRYRVVACSCDVQVTSLDDITPIAVVAAPSQDAAPTLSYQGVGGLRDAVRGQSEYPAYGRIRHTYLMKDVFGVDEEALMSEANYSGTASASAATVAYLNVVAFTGGATTAVMCHGELKFAVRFESPHANNISLRATPPQQSSRGPEPPRPRLSAAAAAAIVDEAIRSSSSQSRTVRFDHDEPFRGRNDAPPLASRLEPEQLVTAGMPLERKPPSGRNY